MREDVLESALAVLKEVGGYFVFKDETGEQFVIMDKGEFDDLSKVSSKKGKQLSLSSTLLDSAKEQKKEEELDLVDAEKDKVSVDEILEKINRDIALYKLLQEEEEIDVMEGVEEEEIDEPVLISQKVRFEPLRGDLPPELQE